jgi:membrane protein YqaA with SNARE-associated domain
MTSWCSAKKRFEWNSATEVTEISARTKALILSGIFVATTVISVVLVLRYWQFIADLRSYGYLGIFIIAFVAGSSVPSPVSYLLLTFTFGGILNPGWVGLSAGFGAGLGGTLVFLLGRGGRRFFPSLQRYSVDERASNQLGARLVNLAQRRGTVVVFAMSALLNPVFAPMAIAMGALRFRLFQFFVMCVAGNLLKAMVISYAGYLGVGTLLRWLGG